MQITLIFFYKYSLLESYVLLYLYMQSLSTYNKPCSDANPYFLRKRILCCTANFQIRGISIHLLRDSLTGDATKYLYNLGFFSISLSLSVSLSKSLTFFPFTAYLWTFSSLFITYECWRSDQLDQD